MKVGNRLLSGKGAREEAAKALTRTILSWRDDQTMQRRGSFRGFEILSRGKSSGFGLMQEDDRLPDLFIRGRATYSANLNGANPIGTVQSIERTMRSLDTLAQDQLNRVARIEKELADYRLQADRPFEHEERLKQLLARQAQLDSLLDLDKGDQQGTGPAPDDEDMERAAPVQAETRGEVARMAAAYMRGSGGAIREIPISERMPPETGQMNAKAVAKNDGHVAFATSGNSFLVVEKSALCSEVQVGDRVSLRFHKGRLSIDNGRDRGR